MLVQLITCFLFPIPGCAGEDLVKSSYADVLAWGVDKLTALSLGGFRLEDGFQARKKGRNYNGELGLGYGFNVICKKKSWVEWYVIGLF